MKGYRTLVFNIGIVLVSAAFEYLDSEAARTVMPPGLLPYLTVISAVNVALRMITTSPVGKSQ